MAGLYFYRPWRWRENINVCVGFVAVLGLVLYDIGIFEVMTLTANIGISSSSAPALLAPRLESDSFAGVVLSRVP